MALLISTQNINYCRVICFDYVVINENLESCYSKIYNLIQADINNGSKDYDPDFIREHVEKLTS